MRFSYVCAGLYASLGFLSSVYANTVDLEGDKSANTPYQTISAALAAALAETSPNTSPTLKLLDKTAVGSSIDLSSLESVTINGQPSGTIISSSGTGFGFFDSTVAGPSSLVLSNVLVSDFSNTQSNGGGAIHTTRDGARLSLTDVQFTGNSADSSGQGGAVYVEGANAIFNYTVSREKTILLNPSSSAKANDNDLAGNIGSTFTKLGSGKLVVNTDNKNWQGNTNIKEGMFVIGDAGSKGAVWGNTASGTFTLNRGAILAGSGTLRAKTFAVGSGVAFAGFPSTLTVDATNLTFNSGSTWRLVLGQPLVVPEVLTIPTAEDPYPLQIQLNGLSIPFSSCGSGYSFERSGYPVAAYRSLSDGTTTNSSVVLAPLNKLLGAYNLQLNEVANGSTSLLPYSLILQQKNVSSSATPAPASIAASTTTLIPVLTPTPIFAPAPLPSSMPSTLSSSSAKQAPVISSSGDKKVAVSFVVPRFPKQASHRFLTSVGQGLMVKCGLASADGNGFADTTFNVRLTNHWDNHRYVDDADMNPTNNSTPQRLGATPLNWVGVSSNFTPGSVYRWELWMNDYASGNLIGNYPLTSGKLQDLAAASTGSKSDLCSIIKQIQV